MEPRRARAPGGSKAALTSVSPPPVAGQAAIWPLGQVQGRLHALVRHRAELRVLKEDAPFLSCTCL
eukprot:768173-Hanusia_phi.AAC.3